MAFIITVISAFSDVLETGSCTPLIRRTSAAVHDPETGVWLDLEIAYNGCFQVSSYGFIFVRATVTQNGVYNAKDILKIRTSKNMNEIISQKAKLNVYSVCTLPNECVII